MSWTGPTPEQERLLWKALSVLAILFLVSVGLGLLWIGVTIARHLQEILIPLGVAAVLAYLLSPLIALSEKAGLRRAVAVPLLFAAVAGAVAAAIYFFGPKLWREAAQLGQSLPGWIDSLRDRATRFLSTDSSTSASLTSFLNGVRTHTEAFSSRIVQGSAAGVGSLLHLVGIALGFLFVPFYLFYMLLDQPRIARSWRDVIPLGNTKLRTEVIVILEQINGYLISFFRGQVIVAAINGLLLAIGLGLVGVDAALLIGFAAAILTVIPYLGMGLITVTTLLVAGFQNDGGVHLCLLSILVIGLTQIIEGTLVSPRVMGEKSGLGPVTVVLSILFWSSLLGGLLGAILAVPLTATLKVLLVRYALVPPSPSSREALEA